MKNGELLCNSISVCSINIGERTVIVVRETGAFDPVHHNIEGSAGLARSFKVVWSKPVPQHEDAGQSRDRFHQQSEPPSRRGSANHRFDAVIFCSSSRLEDHGSVPYR
jgi:hypothetical protein